MSNEQTLVNRQQVQLNEGISFSSVTSAEIETNDQINGIATIGGDQIPVHYVGKAAHQPLKKLNLGRNFTEMWEIVDCCWIPFGRNYVTRIKQLNDNTFTYV